MTLLIGSHLAAVDPAGVDDPKTFTRNLSHALDSYESEPSSDPAGAVSTGPATDASAPPPAEGEPSEKALGKRPMRARAGAGGNAAGKRP